MLDFFNTPDIFSQGTITPNTWPYIKQGLLRNLDAVKKYYYDKPFAVKSNHILIRLLNNLGVSYNINLERFADIVDAKANNISMNFKMSSPIYRGNIFRDIFYGGDIDEIFVCDDDYFDVYSVYNNWKTTSAVKVLYHPKSDLDLLLPNGKYIGTESGTAVISINIAMLAVQYKAFLDKEYKIMLAGESPRSTAHFIHMYVLPNMLDSHLDIALFNRAYNLLTNSQMGVSIKKHVFFTTNYSDQVDNAYKYLIEYYKTNDRSYKTILRSFPCVSYEDFESLLRLPELAPTRQIIWVNVLSRIRAIEFLVKLSKSNNNSFNKNFNNIFLRYFKLYENDRALDFIMSEESQIQNKISIDIVKEYLQS